MCMLQTYTLMTQTVYTSTQQRKNESRPVLNTHTNTHARTHACTQTATRTTTHTHTKGERKNEIYPYQVPVGMRPAATTTTVDVSTEWSPLGVTVVNCRRASLTTPGYGGTV